MKECVDLLVSGNVHVRETVKEALGGELPAGLTRILVEELIRSVPLSLSKREGTS